MTRPLHILVTGEPLPVTRESRGDFPALIRGAVPEASRSALLAIDTRAAEPLPALDDTSGLIITGSASSVTSREPWMLRLEEYLRRALSEGTPILGICFGHQLLAQALGGRVEKNPKGREIGTVRFDALEDDAIVAAGHGTFSVNMTHVDSLLELPREARVLGRTELDPFAAVRFAERVWGVQFHPEVDGEVMLHYVMSRQALLRDEGLDVAALRANAADCPESAAIIRRFLESFG